MLTEYFGYISDLLDYIIIVYYCYVADSDILTLFYL